MIIWINGAFGSGKSSVAEALQNIMPRSHIYDPEQVGYFLWDSFPEDMKRKGNFQHIELWRSFNYEILKYQNYNYDGFLIVPMTIYVFQYYQEIIDRLKNDKIDVRHFILYAEKKTLMERLKNRGAEIDGWEVQHIDKCLLAFDTNISEKRIVTDYLSIEEVAKEIYKNIV